MMSTNNILSPANGEPIIVTFSGRCIGLVLRLHVSVLIGDKGEGMMFTGPHEVENAAFDQRVKVELHAR